MEIEFREIDRSNWEQCCCLEVAENQCNFVAPNAFSLAQAAYEPDCHPLAICCGETMVGFLMWDYDDELGVWEMCRLMVDQKHQGKGIGTAAVQKLLEFIRGRFGHIMFYTSAEPENSVAIGLYEKMGFRKNGRIVDEEVMLELQL